MHVPVDLAFERALDDEVRGALAFATQKLREVAVLTAAVRGRTDAVAEAFADAGVTLPAARAAAAEALKRTG
jgi:5-methyltetrahydropteroyltriglutamate--homocysteine methyltransferase